MQQQFARSLTVCLALPATGSYSEYVFLFLQNTNAFLCLNCTCLKSGCYTAPAIVSEALCDT